MVLLVPFAGLGDPIVLVRAKEINPEVVLQRSFDMILDGYEIAGLPNVQDVQGFDCAVDTGTVALYSLGKRLEHQCYSPGRVRR